MNWRFKYGAFKVLEKLPRPAGDGCYHWFQARNGLLALDRVLAENLRTFHEFTALLEPTGRRFTDARILELGSGWYPATPYLLLYKSGARSICTYDIAEHFSAARLTRFNSFFRSTFGKPPELNGGALPLPQEIRYFPKTDLVTSPPADHSVDLVISRFVLQNVPREVLADLHAVFRRCLRPGGAVVHLVSPSDQRAYSDRSLSLYDFLQYSESEWRKITSRFYYHNRMRLPQYVELFENAGFRIEKRVYKSLSRDSEEFKKFSRLRLHSDFERFSLEELTAASFGFVLCA
jgi:hypothetical protein